VLVDYEGPQEVGKDVAMHIAFAKPQHMTKNEVPADIVNRERDIQTARARESGKPAEIAAKMVEGAVNKFLAEITLMGQPFVKDDKQTVEKMLGAKKAKLNGYAFFVVGEGIEKKSTDFAAEVMAQAGKAH
jgi:elongation factor Ts